MDIYVIQLGDTLYSIAERYGVSVDRLAQDNGLEYPYNLVIGQALVIAYPKQIHTVQQGDTLQSIAYLYKVSLMQILRNNPHLLDRDYFMEGETIVITYNTLRAITTNGFTYPFISKETLIKNLPNLTYLSVFNYTIAEQGNIIEYQDDSEMLSIIKDYNVVPLMMLTSLTQRGEANPELAYRILLNEEYQDNNIENAVDIMKRKGYQGMNAIFNYINEDNQSLYVTYASKIAKRLQEEGYLFFITINYSSQIIDNNIKLEKIDYSKFDAISNGLIFLKLIWGANNNPPAPVSNINNINAIVEAAMTNVSPDKIMIGKPILAYDWSLPYIPGISSAHAMSVDSAIKLAYEVNTTIQFDEYSQTPFFNYNQYSIGLPTQNIVWFVDARSFKGLNNIIIKDNLNGSGIWNIMIYYPQLWTIINSTFDIIKLNDDVSS